MAIDARRALLSELIDHAPLFPPASLPLDEALGEHEAARASGDGWMLRRFVCPASRLAELGDAELRLSLVLDETVELLDARIEAVEVPPGVAAPAYAPAEVYLEERIEPAFRAKVRCGGATVPTPAELAAFVRRCREEGVIFKATAGLHHAVRRPDAHGFLNLLAACVFGDEEQALAEDDPAAFGLTPERFSWRGREAGAGQLAQARRELFSGFGTCSFSEPVEELKAVGLL